MNKKLYFEYYKSNRGLKKIFSFIVTMKKYAIK